MTDDFNHDSGIHDGAVEALGANPEVLIRSSRFFESYAENSVDARSRTSSQWLRFGTAATALRFAAQFAALVDPPRSINLVQRSASYYVNLGLPYGYFLYASFLEKNAAVESLISGPVGHWLQSLASNRIVDVPESSERLEHVALTYPVQQMYLVLAMATHYEVWVEFQSPLESLGESLSVHGTQPIGPQSSPMSDYLGIAQVIQSIHRDSRKARYEAAVVLRRLAQRYESSILSARESPYLWDSLQTPVDIVDLDIVAMTIAVGTALERASMERLHADESPFEDLSRVALIPISVGLGASMQH